MFKICDTEPIKPTANQSPKPKPKLKCSKRLSKSNRSGLQFPVSRVHRKLKSSMPGKRIRMAASIYLAAVLEYMIAEIVEFAGYEAQHNHKQRITARHIQLAVRTDHEVNLVLSDVTIAEGGVVPHIHQCLLPQTQQSKSSQQSKYK